MKTLLSTFLAFGLLIPNKVFCQAKTNFNNMNPQEVRHFLLTQTDSEPIKLMVKKHNTSRISAYTFLALSAVMAIASDKSVDPDTDSVNSIMLATGAGIGFAIAGVCGIIASERLKKAKSMYLNMNSSAERSAFIQIRDDADILKSTF